MKTIVITLLLLVIFPRPSYAREIPVRAESGRHTAELLRIYECIKSLRSGIAICEILDTHGWFTELEHEGSAFSHPYLRYKEEKERLIRTYEAASSSEFSYRLNIFESLAIAADKRGFEERLRIIQALKK